MLLKRIPLRRKLACNWHTFAVLVLIGCGPWEQTPGFRLGGVATAAPESFASMRDHPVIQLESQGALLPRVVNLWGVAFDGAIYVVGTPDRGWVQRVEARPKEVRVRVGDNAYELNATTVNDRELKQRVFTAFQAKYAGGSSFEYTVEDFRVHFPPRTSDLRKKLGPPDGRAVRSLYKARGVRQRGDPGSVEFRLPMSWRRAPRTRAR